MDTALGKVGDYVGPRVEGSEREVGAEAKLVYYSGCATITDIPIVSH